MKTIILLALFALGLSLISSVVAQDTAATRFWAQKLPQIPIPKPLFNRSSQLQGQELESTIAQVRRRILPGDFCIRYYLFCRLTCAILIPIPCRPVGTYGRICYWICITRSSTRKLAGGEPQTFFPQSNLVPGSLIDIRDLADKRPVSDILPKQLVDAFPPLNLTGLSRFQTLFSQTTSDPELLNSVLNSTLSLCSGTIEGDTGICVGSLEDLVTLALPFANKLAYVEFTAGPATNATVVSVGKFPLTQRGFLVCHPVIFPFQVFFCHSFTPGQVNVFEVSVQLPDGTIVSNLVVLCHIDTRGWDPSIQTNGKEACHFISQSDMVWY